MQRFSMLCTKVTRRTVLTPELNSRCCYMVQKVNLSSIENHNSKTNLSSASNTENESKRKWNIRKTRSNKPLVQQQRLRNSQLEAKATEMKLEWRIMGSPIIHRFPTILKEPEPWEVDMTNLQDKIDDIKRKSFVEQVQGTPADLMTDDNPTYEDILKTMPFTPASRTTEADETNNRRSLERKLDESLFLIVKRSRDKYSWQFPQGKILPEENLRQGCERVLDRAVGKVDRWFVSNGPVAYYCYEYPPEIQQQRKQFGAKIFYLTCQYIQGNPKLETRLYKDYAWVTRGEVKEYFHPDDVEYITAVLPA